MKQMETRLVRAIRCAFFSGIFLGLGTIGRSVMAQQPSEGNNDAQQVVVTGSAIRRADKETPSPLQVLSAEDLKRSGYTTISQVLQNITANGSGAMNQGFSGAFAAGASAISLRGLTSAATLVLIDGHRVAPNALSDDNQRSFVDISNIPLDAIERVEILKDGASAVYGSDAMAGVVNIILKRNLVGTTFTGEAGTSTKGGGTTEHFTLTHGLGDYYADGYNAYAALEYRRQSPISVSQRAGTGDWIRTNWLSRGGVDTTPGSAFNPADSPFPNTRQPYLIDPSTGAIQAAPGVPGCTSAQMANNACTYPLSGNLVPKTENLNFLVSVDKKLSETWKLGAKASLFQSTDSIVPVGNGYTFPTSGTYAGVAAGGPSTPITGGVGATPVTYDGMNLGGVIPGSPQANTSKTNSKNYRFAVDLTGVAGEWEIDTSAGYTKNEINEKSILTNYKALQTALNDPILPYSFNGWNPRSVVATIFPSSSQKDISTLEFFDFHATRSLLTLPGGDLGFSTGLGYIHHSMDSPNSAASMTGAAANTSNSLAWVVGEQTNVSAFAEIVAPLFKTFELDAAARFDHFDGGAGHATTPKLGFKWTPTSAFALRGTVATGFRAPNPAERGNSGTVFNVGNSQDPNLCPSGPAAPGAVLKYCNYPAVYFTASNPKLRPEKSVSQTLGFILEPVKRWATTIDFYQIRIRNQIVTGTPSDLPSYGPAQTQICTSSDGTSTTPCGPGLPYQGSNSGTPLFYTVPFVNANQTTTSGIELNSSYQFELDTYGTLHAEIDYSHMLSYVQEVGGIKYQLAGTHGPSSVAGDSANPKDKVQLTLVYNKNDWTVSTAVNHTGSYNLTDPTPAGNKVTKCSEGGVFGGWFPNGNIPGSYCRVPSFVDTDITVFFRESAHLELHAGITNIFNRRPPTDLATYGGGGLPYNPSLHEAGVIGRFLNAGLTYGF